MKDVNGHIQTVSGTPMVQEELPLSPFELFRKWFWTAKEYQLPEHNAISLSTIDQNGNPDSRMVLLKRISDKGFVFFTNYESPKSKQIKNHPYVAFTLHWASFERQIRVKGQVERLSANESDDYFDSRPDGSKIGAWASPQSKPIPNRQYLDNLKADYDAMFEDKPIRRPDFWGGFFIRPHLIEFWQGQPDRLHDRFEYTKGDSGWEVRRLAP